MLGRLEMTVDECIDKYLLFSDRVFEKKAYRVNLKGKIQARFDSTELEQATKDIIFGCGIDREALLKDIPNKCKVYI